MHCGWGEACPPTLVNAGSGALRTAGGGSEPLSCEAGRSRTAFAPLARVRLSARAAGPGRGAKRGLGVRVRLFAQSRYLTRRSIGRAEWRERVWPYVTLSGVAVTIPTIPVISTT